MAADGETCLFEMTFVGVKSFNLKLHVVLLEICVLFLL